MQEILKNLLYLISYLRCLFEFMDPGNTKLLERPDVETMYRAIYDCDDPDEFQINLIPFNSDGSIAKDVFVDYVSRKTHLIQPAIDYQSSLTRKLGGVLLWHNLCVFRSKTYDKLEEEVT